MYRKGMWSGLFEKETDEQRAGAGAIPSSLCPSEKFPGSPRRLEGIPRGPLPSISEIEGDEIDPAEQVSDDELAE